MTEQTETKTVVEVYGEIRTLGTEYYLKIGERVARLVPGGQPCGSCTYEVFDGKVVTGVSCFGTAAVEETGPLSKPGQTWALVEAVEDGGDTRPNGPVHVLDLRDEDDKPGYVLTEVVEKDKGRGVFGREVDVWDVGDETQVWAWPSESLTVLIHHPAEDPSPEPETDPVEEAFDALDEAVELAEKRIPELEAELERLKAENTGLEATLERIKRQVRVKARELTNGHGLTDEVNEALEDMGLPTLDRDFTVYLSARISTSLSVTAVDSDAAGEAAKRRLSDTVNVGEEEEIEVEVSWDVDDYSDDGWASD